MTDKTEILKKIYFDKAGFGSLRNTYKDAKLKDKSITINDVKDFFEDYVEKKNSFGDLILLLHRTANMNTK